MKAVHDQRGFSGVGLMNPKSEVNMGSALRACGVYGCALMAVQGQRFKKCSTDTMKAWRHMPLLEVTNIFDAIPFDAVPVAIELVSGARPLTSYRHPERAFYIFGPEDSGLGKVTVERCRDVIYVPTNGCMNLAATVNVVLYDRMAKSGREFPRLVYPEGSRP